MRGVLGGNFRRNRSVGCKVDGIGYEITSVGMDNDGEADCSRHAPEPHSGHLDVFSVVTRNHRMS